MLPAVRRPRLAVVRAQEGGSPPPTQQQQDDEARIAALEAAARARKGLKAEQAQAFRGTRSSQVGRGVVCGCCRGCAPGGCAGWRAGHAALQHCTGIVRWSKHSLIAANLPACALPPAGVVIRQRRHG